MSKSRRQLHRDHRAARGDVRQDDVAPGFGVAPVVELVVDDGPHPDEPMQWKLELARRIVTRWHGEEAARRGEEHFTRVVRERQPPDEVPEASLPPGIRSTCRRFWSSFSGPLDQRARRLIAQGAVKVDGEP